MLKAQDLPPPYHLVAVAAAATHILGFMERYPEQVKSLVLCNPALGVDPSRAGVLNDRAAQAEQQGMRAVLGITLDKSYPAELTDRATYEAYRGRYLAGDPVGFGLANRMLAQTTSTCCCPRSNVPPWWWPAVMTRSGLPPAPKKWRARLPAPALN